MTHGLLDELADVAGLTVELWDRGGPPSMKERRPVVGPLGRFGSISGAALAAGVSQSTMTRWCQAGKNGWRYEDEVA